MSSPMVHIGVLPPPQRLGRPVGLVVPQPVDEVGSDRREVIREPERGRHGVLVRVEDLGVLVAVGEPFGQPDPESIEIGVGADIWLGIPRRYYVLAGAK